MHCATCTCPPPDPEIPAEELTVGFYAPSDNSVIDGPRGVRILHKPTGLCTASHEHRSQLQNTASALEYLRELLVDNGWFDR